MLFGLRSEPDWERQLEGYDGILVPGGFGKRGIDGMLNAIRFARENQVPYFGICLGMQTMVIELARTVSDLPGARRFRQARYRWHAERYSLRPRESSPVFRHLPGHADHGDRVCAQRLRPGAGGFHRIQFGNAA